MEKHLFFICPTDHLETIINHTFKQENYYWTSLGNSILFDNNLIEEINGLIESKRIREITFVLSDNNKFVMDGLENQRFSKIKGLDHFYHEISKQKKSSHTLWQTDHLQTPIFAYYLNMKIKELQPKLSSWFVDEIKINAKIYNRQKNTFREIHDLFRWDYSSLN